MKGKSVIDRFPFFSQSKPKYNSLQLTSLDILKTLRSLQEEDSHSGLAPSGVFLSRRYHPVWGFSRRDNNIFFSASICYVLRQLSHKLAPEEKEIAEQIISRTTESYAQYRNKYGGLTYNFWLRENGKHFPNSRFLYRFRHFELPDDLDTTAMIYLSQPFLISRKKADRLRKKLTHHTNGSKGIATNTLARFKDKQAYSSWIGDKMPVEVDICVLCNFILWVEEKDLTWNVHDSQCIDILLEVIENGYYFTQPFSLSPYYPDPVVQLYHLSRLFCTLEGFKQIKQKLSDDLRKVLADSPSPMQKLLLENSLVKLGVNPQTFSNNGHLAPEDISSFPWFRASFLSVYAGFPGGLFFAKQPLFQMNFTCEAFNMVLLLEHRIFCNNPN